jgi:hypothetical protein
VQARVAGSAAGHLQSDCDTELREISSEGLDFRERESSEKQTVFARVASVPRLQ